MPVKKLPKFSTRDVRVSAWAPAKPQRVYETFIADSEPRNMGRFRLAFSGSFLKEGRGVFVDLEPARKISWIWEKSRLPKGTPALVSVFLEAKNLGCQITIVHAGFSTAASSNKAFGKFRAFWEDCLNRLSRGLKATAAANSDLLAR